MATTVTYKGNTLTTVNNQTRTLTTQGKYLEDDITLVDITSGGGSGDGYVWQDAQGYVHLSDEEGTQTTVEPLSVTQNGTYTAVTGHAYNPVTVNVSGGTPTPTPTPWTRPSTWPDLSKMDVSGGDVIYMTSYADETRGFCSFYVNCTGSYTVEVGSISGTTFTADSIQTYSSGDLCRLYYGSVNGTFKVLRVTGTSITKFRFNSTNGTAVTIGTFYGYERNQGIIDIVGKLPSCNELLFSYMFNLINVDISDVVLSAQNYIFYYCYSLTSADVSSWNTAAVTTMSSMFSGCNSLTSLDVSNWNTAAVTNMANMFNSCNSLTSLDVSNWNTAAVTNMSSMFSSCYTLASLDVSNWNTAAVTNMSSMFSSCNSLTSLDVSNWNTAAVTSMSSMFNSCNSLTSLDVSNWNTAKVTNMGSMFSSCNSLTSLDVSNWNTAAVTSMSSMFNSCNSLTSLDVSNWNTAKVTNMGSMFSSCYTLASLDVSNWNTAAVTSMANMFNSCYTLASLDVSSFDFSLVTTASNAGSMFRYCFGLHSLTLPSTLSVIGTYCFGSMRGIKEWHFKSTTPPTLSNTNAFDNMTDFGGKIIYVPTASLSAYQSASNWSTYASYMQGE